MNCKTVREWILTDDLDGEIRQEKKEEIETHLAGCSRCREFKAMARKAVIEPFKGAERVTPPDALWLEIKERIEQGQEQAAGPLVDFMVRIKNSFHIRKPAVAVAAMMGILLIAVMLLHTPTHHQGIVSLNLEDQIEYMAGLVKGSNHVSMDQDEGYGTSMEEYFL